MGFSKRSDFGSRYTLPHPCVAQEASLITDASGTCMGQAREHVLKLRAAEPDVGCNFACLRWDWLAAGQ